VGARGPGLDVGHENTASSCSWASAEWCECGTLGREVKPLQSQPTRIPIRGCPGSLSEGWASRCASSPQQSSKCSTARSSPSLRRIPAVRRPTNGAPQNAGRLRRLRSPSLNAVPNPMPVSCRQPNAMPVSSRRLGSGLITSSRRSSGMVSGVHPVGGSSLRNTHTL